MKLGRAYTKTTSSYMYIYIHVDLFKPFYTDDSVYVLQVICAKCSSRTLVLEYDVTCRPQRVCDESFLLITDDKQVISNKRFISRVSGDVFLRSKDDCHEITWRCRFTLKPDVNKFHKSSFQLIEYCSL